MFQSLLRTDELDFTRKCRCKRAAWGGASACAQLGPKHSKSQGGKEMAGCFPIPFSLPHCSKDVKTCFRWKLSSASPKYLLLQTKTRWIPVLQMFPKKQSSPGSYSCKRIAVLRELKMSREEEIHRIASVAGSVTRCRLMFWMIPNPVSAKLLVRVGGSMAVTGFYVPALSWGCWH